MQFPQLNINGTDGLELLTSYEKAMHAVEDALNVLRKLDVHGRDYQTITDIRNAVLTAQREHRERIAKVDGVWRDLIAIGEDIARQINERQGA